MYKSFFAFLLMSRFYI